MFLEAAAEAGEASGGGAAGAIVPLLILVVYVASFWKVFTKAGEPGWAAIVPIYNIITLLKIAGKPVWWVVLFCIPVANVIAAVLVFIAVAKSFGKGTGFAIGLLFVGFIFWPMLAFGDAKFIGKQAA